MRPPRVPRNPSLAFHFFSFRVHYLLTSAKHFRGRPSRRGVSRNSILSTFGLSTSRRPSRRGVSRNHRLAARCAVQLSRPSRRGVSRNFSICACLSNSLCCSPRRGVSRNLLIFRQPHAFQHFSGDAHVLLSFASGALPRPLSYKNRSASRVLPTKKEPVGYIW